MSQPQIVIDPDEAKRIEKNLILRDIYYHLTGYYSNAKTLRDACLKKEYKFKLSAVKNWLTNQSTWQYMLHHRKIFHELVMVKFHIQIVYISVTSYFLHIINIRERHGKQYYKL